MGLFLSVNAGSYYGPRLVQLTYTPKKVTKNTKKIGYVPQKMHVSSLMPINVSRFLKLAPNYSLNDFSILFLNSRL